MYARCPNSYSLHLLTWIFPPSVFLIISIRFLRSLEIQCFEKLFDYVQIILFVHGTKLQIRGVSTKSEFEKSSTLKGPLYLTNIFKYQSVEVLFLLIISDELKNLSFVVWVHLTVNNHILKLFSQFFSKFGLASLKIWSYTNLSNPFILHACLCMKSMFFGTFIHYLSLFVLKGDGLFWKSSIKHDALQDFSNCLLFSKIYLIKQFQSSNMMGVKWDLSFLCIFHAPLSIFSPLCKMKLQNFLTWIMLQVRSSFECMGYGLLNIFKPTGFWK